MQDPDPRILVRAREGDLGAFEELVRQYQADVWRFAFHFTRDRAMAEDVTQEAFLSLWRSGARYDPTRGSVRTWLLGVVRNRAIDLLRRQATRAPTVELELERLHDTSPTAELTDTAAVRREAAREVRGALEVLPADQLKVIELAYFGGLTHSEIAEALGMPLGTVKGRMRLAMEKIRTTLAEGV